MKHVKMMHRGKQTRLDTLLVSLTGLEPDEVALLIAMGGAYLGKHRCKDPAHKVRRGEEVSAYYRLPLTMQPVSFQQAWVLSDRHGLLLANKPSGLPTQGRRDADYMAFYELLKQHLPGYVGLHHRLDQDTSGLMLFTREKALNKAVAALFRERKVHKHYLALVVGDWQGPDEQTIQAPIATRHGDKGTRHLVAPDGRPAETRVTRIACRGKMHLIVAKPVTGRTHQIRVHMAHLGLPLLGDTWYDGPPADGFLLHCFRLAWPAAGALVAGDHVCGVPPTWFTGPTVDFESVYHEWWRSVCSS